MRKPYNPPHPFAVLLPKDQAAANPPFVNWYPAAGADRYRVLFRSPEGERCWETPFSFYTPPEALAPGAWSVTVEALDAGGAVLASDTRETRLLTPVTEDVDDLNAITRRPGARLYLSDAEVDAINSATGERGAWRRELLAMADHVEESLLAGPDEPEGYPDGVWNFDTWKKNNSLCIALEDALFAATAAWRLTGEARYREPAMRLLTHTVRWDPTGTTGVWENDHSDQALLHAFAVAYDTFGDALPEDLRRNLRRSIAGRCRDIFAFLNPFHMKELSCGLMGSPANNHAWFVAEAMGLGGLALWDEEPEAKEWVALAAQLHTGAFFPYGDPEGGWHEGIDYWSYSLLFLFEFADALRETAGVDLYRHPWLRKTTAFKLLAHPPAGGYVPFGDVKHHPPLPVDRLIAMRLASRHADPLEWRYVDAIEDGTIDRKRYLPHALAWSDRGGITREQAAAAQPGRVVHYPDMGWVVANSDPFDASEQVLFAFRSGGKHPDAHSHNHADVNHFTLCVGGEKLLWDAGYYDSYESPHHKNYSRHSKAHNTLLVDGKGQRLDARGVHGSITRCDIRGMDVEIESDASDPMVYGAPLLRFVRRASLRDLTELTIEDDIATSEPVRLSLLLHSVYPIVWNPAEKTLAIRGERFELLGRLETDEAIEAVLTTAFDQACDVRSSLLDTFDEYPDQYHLEMRTARPLTAWRPRLSFSWRRIGTWDLLRAAEPHARLESRS